MVLFGDSKQDVLYKHFSTGGSDTLFGSRCIAQREGGGEEERMIERERKTTKNVNN